MIFRTISRSGAARALAATIRPARSSPALDVITARHIEPIGGALAHRSHLSLPRGFATDTERILGRKGGNRAEEEGVDGTHSRAHISRECSEAHILGDP